MLLLWSNGLLATREQPSPGSLNDGDSESGRMTKTPQSPETAERNRSPPNTDDITWQLVLKWQLNQKKHDHTGPFILRQGCPADGGGGQTQPAGWAALEGWVDRQKVKDPKFIILIISYIFTYY